jgi:hypothetical protein
MPRTIETGGDPMSAVTGAVSGCRGDEVGTLALSVSDPEEQVIEVDFYITGSSGLTSGPYPADRMLSFDLYEKDVSLDAAYASLIQPVLRLIDGSEQWTDAESFGVRRAETGALASSSVTSQGGRVQVSVQMGDAVNWACWAARGRWPTGNGRSGGAVVDSYLRFEGDPTETVFSTDGGVVGAIWYVVAVGLDVLGRPGPRRTASVQVVA